MSTRPTGTLKVAEATSPPRANQQKRLDNLSARSISEDVERALGLPEDFLFRHAAGRPRLLASDPKLRLAKKLYADKSLSIDDICQTLKISRLTHYRYVTRQ
jgi:hypothetical protein